MVQRTVLLASALVATVTGGSWSVLNDRFSAVSVGIAFEDSNTGWTTFTDGASEPLIVRTTNAGKNWTPVNDTGSLLIATGFAAKPQSTNVAMTAVVVYALWKVVSMVDVW